MIMRRFALMVPVVLLATQQVSAAVYGLPEPPTPAPTPQFWFGFSDDFLGMAVLNSDDYRTANISMGGRYDAWRFAVDSSMLTNRGRDGTTPSRTDELTYSLGYALIDEEREGRLRPLFTLGVGGRTYGNLGGEEIQNRVHKTFGYQTVHLPYDPEHGTEAFAFYHGRLTLVPSWDYQGRGPFGRWAFQLESGGLASTGEEFQWYGGANLVSVGSDSLAWIGARYQWNGGNNPTATSAIVAEKETGWWGVVGLSRSPGVLFTASINPSRETVAGTLGLTIDRTATPNNVGVGHRVDQALKFFPGGGNIGLDIRWQPQWLAERSLSQRDVLVVNYDFGAVAEDQEWQDCYVGFDQLVIGWGPSWNIPPATNRLIWTVGAYVAGGLRLERIHAEDGTPRFADGGVHATGVVQGELGTRFGYRFTDRGDSWFDSLRLGVGIDGWLPFNSVTVSNGNDVDHYLVPGYSVHVTAGVTVIW